MSGERLRVDLHEAVCDRCGRSLFAYAGKKNLADYGLYPDWPAWFVREFMADSRCAYAGCGGRPLAPIVETR